MNVGWFYIVNEEAEPILEKIFKAGIQPGSVVTVPNEDFEILREGIIHHPIMVAEQSNLVTPPGYSGPRAA